MLCYRPAVELGSVHYLGYIAVLAIYKGNLEFDLWLSSCLFLNCTFFFFFNYLPIIFSEVFCVAKLVYQKSVEHSSLGN